MKQIIYIFFILASAACAAERRQDRVIKLGKSLPLTSDDQDEYVGGQSAELEFDNELYGYDGFDLPYMQTNIQNLICDLIEDCNDDLSFFSWIDLLAEGRQAGLTPFVVEDMRKDAGNYGGTLVGGTNLATFTIFLVDYWHRIGLLTFDDAQKLLLLGNIQFRIDFGVDTDASFDEIVIPSEPISEEPSSFFQEI